MNVGSDFFIPGHCFGTLGFGRIRRCSLVHVSDNLELHLPGRVSNQLHSLLNRVINSKSLCSLFPESFRLWSGSVIGGLFQGGHENPELK